MVRQTMERLARLVCCGELGRGEVNATAVAANVVLQSLEADDRASAKRAAAMSDAELEQALEDEFAEWKVRRENQ